MPAQPDPSAGASGPAASGDNTADAVGKWLKSPWLPSVPGANITQQYGTTDYTGEPAGHGSPHWHAGVDLGVGTGTIVEFPQLDSNALKGFFASMFGGAINLIPGQKIPYGTYHRGTWNGRSYTADPGGYGSHACTITLPVNDQGDKAIDVVLGHAMAWLQEDGANVTAGAQLIRTDCEGNCSGPHLHFEVRPEKGTYGTDVDPWPVVTNGEAGSYSNPAQAALDDLNGQLQGLQGAVQSAVTAFDDTLIGMGEVALGTIVIGGALYLLVQGVRGMRAVPAASRPSPGRRPASPEPVQHPAARVARAGSQGAAPGPPAPARAPASAAPVPRRTIVLTPQQAGMARYRVGRPVPS